MVTQHSPSVLGGRTFFMRAAGQKETYGRNRVVKMETCLHWVLRGIEPAWGRGTDAASGPARWSFLTPRKGKD